MSNFFFRSPLEKNVFDTKNEQKDIFDIVAENSFEKEYDPGVLNESNRFSAVVLAVMTSTTLKTNDPLAKRALQLIPEGFDQTNSKAVMIFGRIDTIHSNLPDPFLTADPVQRMNLILLHPLFTGYRPESDEASPSEGEIVFVDFRHKAKQNYIGPYYIGKTGKTISAAEMAAVTGKVAFENSTINGGGGLKSRIGGQKLGNAGPDGVKNKETRVLSQIVSPIPEFPILHRLPAGRRAGDGQNANDQFPDFMIVPDLYWLAVTSGTIEGALLRMVSGAQPSGGGGLNFSRPPDSYISLDSVSIGIAHWWAQTIPAILVEIATKQPKIAEWAWGKYAAERMVNKSWIDSQIYWGPNPNAPPLPKADSKGRVGEENVWKDLTSARGFKPHNEAKYNWLLSGWHEIGRHPEIIKIQADKWFARYVGAARAEMARYGFRTNKMLAALARMSNSSPVRMKNDIKKAYDATPSKNEMEILRKVFTYYKDGKQMKTLDFIESQEALQGSYNSSIPLRGSNLHFLSLAEITRAGRDIDPTTNFPDFVVQAKNDINVFQ